MPVTGKLSGHFFFTVLLSDKADSSSGRVFCSGSYWFDCWVSLFIHHRLSAFLGSSSSAFCFSVGVLLLLWCVLFVLQCFLNLLCFFVAFGSAFLMCASVRVEGKLFEVSGKEGAAFPFRVSEVIKRRLSVIKPQVDEFRCLAREIVHFCSSKGEPLWARTFRGSNYCLLLQLRKNKRGRFIHL